MSLTRKITLLLVAVFGSFFAAQIIIHNTVLRPSFDALERAEAITDANRCHDAISQEIAHLSTLCNDWARWDDSYAFVQDGNETFIDNTLTGDVLEVAKLAILLYCDSTGRIIWKDARSTSLSAEELWSAFPFPAFDPDHFLLLHETLEGEISGVMLVSGYPLLVVSRPVLTSSGEGPIVGSLIMGRLLDAELTAHLEEQTHVSFITMSSQALSPIFAQHELDTFRTDAKPLLRVVNSNTLEVFAGIPYLNSTDELILKAEVPRSISREGQSALTSAMLTFLITSLAALLALTISIRLIVLEPLVALTAHATHTASTHDWTARIHTTRNDEFGRLSDEVDGMVAALGTYHSAANAMAHDAGRAELASGAVHDIGNAINSAGVCAHLLSDVLRGSALPKLLRIPAVLHDLDDDSRHLEEHRERMVHLSTYMTELTDLLLQERDDSLQELEALHFHIQRVIQVTHIQMSAVNSKVHALETSIAEIAEMAMAVTQPAFHSEHFRVKTSLAECGHVWLDRSKVLQVLTTLLPFAAESVSNNATGNQHITLSIRPVGDDVLRFEVTDNGKGLTPPELSTLFRQLSIEHSVRVGTDLHHCAIAAHAMGGTLSATSDGPGLGSTFTLDVPLVYARPSRESVLEGGCE